MKVLILGATGRTGRRLAALALERGHQVAAILRDPGKVPDPRIQIVEGTPYDAETVARAVAGCDAVVNVLNVSRRSDNPWAPLAAPPDLISKACANALAAMEKVGIKRYVTLSTVGASESWRSLPFVVRMIVKYSNLRSAFDDHTREEALLARSGADYTVARAPMLNDKEGPPGVLVVRPGEDMKGSIGRKAVAEFLLSILESGAHGREIVHISSRG